MSEQMKNRLVSLTVAMMLVLTGLVSGTVVIDTFAVERTAPAPALDLQQPPTLTQDEQVRAQIYDTASRSVVAITNIQGGLGAGSGSGFVIDSEGRIVTNFHVVEGATELIVNFLDGTITRAEVIGLDPDSDIAVIDVDIPVERLFPLEFADSDSLTVGQNVIAIGSPFGQRWTLTSGVVSALDRTLNSPGQYSIGAAIQTDAPINPGNSGGPLLDLNGRVIGVNSQIISESGSNSGVGFAVPSNLVRRVAIDLIETGDVAYSFIGIGALQGGNITLQLIEALNLPDNQRGVPIANVTEGGPADQAGLLPAEINGNNLTSIDIITAIDGQPVIDFSSLISYLAQETRPGQTVTLTVLRDGQLIDLPLTLGERPLAQ